MCGSAPTTLVMVWCHEQINKHVHRRSSYKWTRRYGGGIDKAAAAAAAGRVDEAEAAAPPLTKTVTKT